MKLSLRPSPKGSHLDITLDGVTHKNWEIDPIFHSTLEAWLAHCTHMLACAQLYMRLSYKDLDPEWLAVASAFYTEINMGEASN